MLKKRLVFGSLVSLTVLAAVVLSPQESKAVPIFCNQGNEQLGLTPTGVVTVDGFSVRRSTVDGRFHADGGIDFDVTTADVIAVEPPFAVCLNSASAVTLTVTDPFTRVRSIVGAVAP